SLSDAALFLSPPPAPPSADTLSLHDALPIYLSSQGRPDRQRLVWSGRLAGYRHVPNPSPKPFQRVQIHEESFSSQTHSAGDRRRSEEHTSELQSRENLVCRRLLEKKKKSTSL